MRLFHGLVDMMETISCLNQASLIYSAMILYMVLLKE